MKSRLGSNLLERFLNTARPYRSKLFKWADRLSNSKTTTAFFVLTLIAYFGFQVYLTARPVLIREAPIELDDSYSYILKAAQVKYGCFMQDCPALNDLREQLASPVSDSSMANYRNLLYILIFVVYHPLYSFLLSGISSLGLSLEASYAVVYIAGKILLTGSVAYWLLALWGRKVATVSLILLTLAIFGGHGLHYIVPTTLALCVAFFTWTEVYRKTNRVDFMLIPLILVMLLTHLVGRLYAGVAVAMYLVLSPWPFRFRTWFVGGLSSLVVLLSFLIPSWVSSPELNYDPSAFYVGRWNYFGDLVSSSKISFSIVQAWANPYGGLVVAGLLVVVGILVYPSNQRSKILFVGSTLFAITLASFFYVLPWYGNSSFQRVWIPMAVFFVGAIGSSVVSFVVALFAQIRLLISRSSKSFSQPTQVLSNRGWRLTVVLVAFFALAGTLGRYFLIEANYYQSSQWLMGARQNFVLDPEQPQLMIEDSELQTRSAVLYMQEISMLFYLSHGTLDRGAVFWPALRLTPDVGPYLDARLDKLGYMVAANPIFLFPVTPQGALLLSDQDTLLLRSSAPMDITRFQILVGARTTDLVLSVTLGNQTDKEVINVELFAGPQEWISLDSELSAVDRVGIVIKKGDENAQIGGIRLSETATTFWPWGSDLSLRVVDPEGGEISVEFSDLYLSEGINIDLEVMDDNGYTLLARIIH